MNDYALTAGTVLHGKSYIYTIQKMLGQGTFGITYLATTRVKVAGALGELETTLQVAIKEFFMQDINGREGNTVTCGSRTGVYYDYRKKFAHEAENLSRLHHPSIVKVLEFFEANNTVYFSMEFIEGGSLNAHIQANDSLSDREALEAVRQIGEALSFMHQNRMLHLDLKPLNIMRRQNGELVLIDFGLSKTFDEHGEPESSTRIGCGTRGYAPIEQSNYRKSNNFPATLDIYALGATLFKMLTGVTPPDASEVLNEGFPEATMRTKGVSDDLILLTSWAMEPMKFKRPQTVSEFLAEVTRLLPGASSEPHQSEEIYAEVETARTEPGYSEQNYSRKDKDYSEPFPDSGWDWEPSFGNKANNRYETCNGMEIRWAKNLPETKKERIREAIINKLKKIGDEPRVVYTSEYGPETVAIDSLMSLRNFTPYCIFQLIRDERRSDFSLTFFLPQLLSIILDLELSTGLPFRLAAKDEFRYTHFLWSAGNRWNVPFYSPQEGILYDEYERDGESENVLTRDNVIRNCIEVNKFQIVCDGTKPVWNGNLFDIPCTQRIVDEIQPIGLGLYKIREGKYWNVTSPEAPMSSFLPEDYESISPINLESIPGPGLPPLFLGITAQKGDMTSYYRYENRGFKLICSLSKKEIEKRRMWT